VAARRHPEISSKRRLEASASTWRPKIYPQEGKNGWDIMGFYGILMGFYGTKTSLKYPGAKNSSNSSIKREKIEKNS
jgi:hypothetical protein